MFPKIKRGWLIGVALIILLALLNPTYLNFKEFTGLTGVQSKHLHKKANLLVCSVYTNDLDDKKYLGVAKNFIDITPKPKRAALDTTSTNAITTTVDTNTTALPSTTTTTGAERQYLDSLLGPPMPDSNSVNVTDLIDTMVKPPHGFKLDKDPFHLEDSPNHLKRKHKKL